MVSTRPMRKQAKLVTTGVLPQSARPAPTPIMFCSAMPISKWRCGYFLAKASVIVDLERSASRTTSSGWVSASSTRASPKASRVALPMEDLRHGLVGLLFLGGLAVPVDDVLHEGDALALDGLGVDGARAVRRLGPAQGLLDLREIMAVDGLGMPAEGLQLVGHGLDAHDLAHGAVDLAVVVVDDHRQVVELELGRGHERLPDLAFLQLAVAEDAIGPVILLVELGGQRHADGHRKPLAERPRGHLDARQALAVGMALQRAAELAQGHELGARKVAGVSHRRVERRAAVALGKHDAVAIGPGRILRVVLEEIGVEHGQDVDDRQRASRMARAR